jgi:hypothetical protein
MAQRNPHENTKPPRKSTAQTSARAKIEPYFYFCKMSVTVGLRKEEIAQLLRSCLSLSVVLCFYNTATTELKIKPGTGLGIVDKNVC